MSPTAAAPASLETLRKFLVAVGTPERWLVIKELAKGETLPVREIAQRIGLPESNVSKLMVSFRASGIVERNVSRAYRMKPQYIVSGGEAVDLGVMLLRLDRVSAE